jgi:uncharacterized protein YdaU (DUF1376 family)
MAEISPRCGVRIRGERVKERSGMSYDVVAFEADELARQLDPWTEGVFHRMLRLAWMNGSVPADLKQLAELCRVRPSSLEKAWPMLSKFWEPCGENSERLRNKKQESERIFLESKRESARESAKLSWKSKKRKQSRKANAVQPQSEGIASHPIPSQLENTSPIVPLTLGEFQSVILTPDEHEKLKAKLNGSFDNLVARLDRYSRTAPAKFRKYISHYAVLLSWHDKDIAEGKVKPSKPAHLSVFDNL